MKKRDARCAKTAPWGYFSATSPNSRLAPEVKSWVSKTQEDPFNSATSGSQELPPFSRVCNLAAGSKWPLIAKRRCRCSSSVGVVSRSGLPEAWSVRVSATPKRGPRVSASGASGPILGGTPGPGREVSEPPLHSYPDGDGDGGGLAFLCCRDQRRKQTERLQRGGDLAAAFCRADGGGVLEVLAVIC